MYYLKTAYIDVRSYDITKISNVIFANKNKMSYHIFLFDKRLSKGIFAKHFLMETKDFKKYYELRKILKIKK